MKYVYTFIGIGLLLASCSTPAPQEATASEEEVTAEANATEETAEDNSEVKFPYSAGEEFDASLAITADELKKQLETFTGDSMEVILAADIQACCKKKGCWMTLDMGGEEDMRVRFKDYAFFVPLNSDGHRTVVKGKVFRDTIPVPELQHLAEDGGATEEEIAAITEPEVTMELLASGVVVE